MPTSNCSRRIHGAVYVIALVMGVFQIVTSYKRVLSPVPLQNVHLMLALLLIYLMAIAKELETKKRAARLALYTAALAVSLAGTLYIHVNYVDMVLRVGKANTADIVVGVAMILVTVAATCLSFGAAIPVLTGLFILYMFIGKSLPGILYHSGFSFRRVVMTMVTNFGGIYGTLLNVSATFIALFMIFGGVLGSTGGSRFFMDLALGIAGRFSAGPAMSAVISSALMGSINGSATANVATTGVFTIPLMKQRGYAPHFAGAVEAVASTGGMFLPPVMGVGAFVMAELTGISYAVIAASAALPAILYYLLASVVVIQRSRKMGLKPIPVEDIQPLRKTMKEGWMFLLPIVAIIYCMVEGFSISKAALVGLGVVFLIFLYKLCTARRGQALTLSGWKPLLDGTVDGVKQVTGIAASMACVGMMVDCIVCSGLATRLVSLVLKLGANSSFASLVIVMLVALLFGMGVPTTASYVILAVMAAPALLQLGLPVLSVHLFLYYFTIIGNVTPPVGSACIVASKMSGGDYYKTCFEACKMSFCAFILPYIFVYRPEMLSQGSFWAVVEVMLTAALGLFALAMAFERMFLVKNSLAEQAMLTVIAAVLIYPSPLWLSCLALAGYAAIGLRQYKPYKAALAAARQESAL